MNAPEVAIRPESGRVSALGTPPEYRGEGVVHKVFFERLVVPPLEGPGPASRRGDDVERIGVVGAGTMGAGIAQIAGLGGCETGSRTRSGGPGGRG